jgi:hypothetical protein
LKFLGAEKASEEPEDACEELPDEPAPEPPQPKRQSTPQAIVPSLTPEVWRPLVTGKVVGRMDINTATPIHL